MRTNNFKLLKIVLLGVALCFLGACNTTKSKGGAASIDEANRSGAQTSGIGERSGFGDKHKLAANRLKAPYDQIYLFEFDKYDVQPDDAASIEVQANYLTSHQNAKVRLEGHTDERGSREYNIALGWKRAKAVSAILEQQGVAQSQIAVVSFGKEKPVAFGHDEDAQSQNRRVNLTYEAK
jgi:peptidoglycan-associated lipoprotein